MTHDDLLRLIEQCLRQARQAVDPQLQGIRWRRLEDAEVSRLESCGNSSPDWTGVAVSGRAALEAAVDCRFEGTVRLDIVSGSLLRSSTIRDCDLSGLVSVDRVGMLRGFLVEDGARILFCHSVSHAAGSRAGTGVPLELGCETGERRLRAVPTLRVDLAEALTSGRIEPGVRAAYEAGVDDLASFVEGMTKGRIGRNSSITCTALVDSVFLGEECSIEAACSVRDCIMLGGSGEGSRIADGSIVTGSALQWGATVQGHASVSDSIVGERALVERGARLSGSLLGPDCSQGCGEIAASLIGPLVAAHHESLLVAVRWPGGCGNVGYGANMGSNHTSRLPDQEASVGSGVFLGLGCSVKFPISLERAPGTVIATGVVVPPQRLEFPFSLVTGPSSAGPGLEPGMLEIRPGWVIYGNLFALLRNLRKYEERRKASRSPAPEGPAGASALGMVLEARGRLRRAEGREHYTADQIPGIGACFMTERSRLRGIEGYDLFTAWILLRDFVRRLGPGPGSAEAVTTDLGHEFPGRSPGELLAIYGTTLKEMSAKVLESRSRDFERGSSIIDDYSSAHLSPGTDPVLREILRALDEEARSAASLQ